MSVIDFVLLALAVVPEIVFFILFIHVRVTRPIETRADGGRYITDHDKHRVWLKKAERLENTFKPVGIHTLALAAFVLWLIYRTVLSFL